MTDAEWLPALDLVFRALARASVEGTVLVAAVWVVTRALPRLPARARATLWWIACARFAVSLAGIAPIDVPLTLPTPLALALSAPLDDAPSFAVETTGSGHPTGAMEAPPIGRLMAPPGILDHETRRVPPTPAPSAAALSWSWTAWVAAAWLMFLVGALARVGLALRRSAHAVAAATRLDPGALPSIGRVAQRFGLKRVPDVRLSHSLRSPQLIWAGRASVLLPAEALRTWSASDVELALAHEFAHLRRRDLAWGLGVALVARAFAFHPLARLASREYALAREAACDADVLARTDASPFDYGKLLLAMGVTRRPALSLSSAAWSGRSLKRRLVMLEHHSASRRGKTGWIVIPAALIAGLVGLTAAAPGPQLEPEPPQPAVAGAPATQTPSAALAAEPVVAARDQTPPPPPPPPKPAVPPRPPAPPPPPPHAHAGLHMESMDEVADAWVYLSSGHSFQHGSRHDRRIAEGLRQAGEPLFWFARDGKEYVIRDKATLDRVERLLSPEHPLVRDQREVSESQAKLAQDQAHLAMKQAEVAARMAELGAKQAALGAEEGKLRAEAMADRSHASIDEAKARDMRAREKQYEYELQALETELRRHEEKLRAFEPEQAALARQMETRARELEAQMERTSRELKELLTKAIASAVAQPVR